MRFYVFCVFLRDFTWHVLMKTLETPIFHHFLPFYLKYVFGATFSSAVPEERHPNPPFSHHLGHFFSKKIGTFSMAPEVVGSTVPRPSCGGATGSFVPPKIVGGNSQALQKMRASLSSRIPNFGKSPRNETAKPPHIRVRN